MSDNGKLLRKDLAEVKTPYINDSTYEFLRNNVEVVLPAIGVAYAVIAGYWNWPFVVEITGTLSAIGVLFGVIIKANRKRNDKVEAIKSEIKEQDKADAQVGSIILGTGDQDLGLATLQLDKHPEEFADVDEIRLKVLNVDLDKK